MRTDVPTLKIDRLSASYGGVPVLKALSLQVRRGEIVTLIGANGAGKSTTIKCICGLLKPRAGTIALFGEDVTGQSPDRLVPRGLAVVLEGRRLFGDMTLAENLLLGAWSRRDATAARDDLDRVMAMFPELAGRLAAKVGCFSGGQQQMVAFARALMSRPKLLLLDEPTIGLAPVVVDRLSDLVVEIARSGVDILIVEQNAETALAIAHRAYVIEGGEVIAEGGAADIAASDRVQQAYLGI